MKTNKLCTKKRSHKHAMSHAASTIARGPNPSPRAFARAQLDYIKGKAPNITNSSNPIDSTPSPNAANNTKASPSDGTLPGGASPSITAGRALIEVLPCADCT